MNKLTAKLDKLPKSPGVYFFKNSSGEIIYVGKAVNLRNRVRSYFQKGNPLDTKTSLLVADIKDLDWQIVETEVDALFLEAELVRRYRPHYNILLRDDKASQYVRVDYKSQHPIVSLVRRPLPDKAEYFGPFNNGAALNQSLKFLRKAFPYATSQPNGKRVSLHYHLGLDPGLEEGRTNLVEYRSNLRNLMQYLKGSRVALIKQLEKDMKTYSKHSEFEKAARIRDQLKALQDLGRQNLLSSTELAEANRDHALNQLTSLLGLPSLPKRIEGFDISHIQGSDNTASMVVFTLGLPDKTSYRKFKLRVPGNNDFAHIHEALSRRLSPTNIKKWGLPELILIDGGKGQLSSALRARDEAGQSSLPMIGLAKAEEEIIIHDSLSLPTVESKAVIEQAKKLGSYTKQNAEFVSVILPVTSPAIKLLQRVRDESHRFALSYHGSLRARRSTASQLDSLPGVGAVTRKKLIRNFGSQRAASSATVGELQALFGNRRGEQLFEQLQALNP